MLSNDLNCDLPLGYLSKEEIFAEFESLWAQLLHYSAASVDQRTGFKAGIGYLAHLHYDSTIDSRDFTVHKECFRAINSLRKNDFFFYFPYLSSIHEKAMYRYVLDGKPALAWELPYPGHLSST